MPSVPLTLGLAVPDRAEGGRWPRRRGGDGPSGRGGVGHAIRAADVGPRGADVGGEGMALQAWGGAACVVRAADVGLAVLDCWEGATTTPAGREWPCRPGEGPVMPSVSLTLGLTVL